MKNEGTPSDDPKGDDWPYIETKWRETGRLIGYQSDVPIPELLPLEAEEVPGSPRSPEPPETTEIPETSPESRRRPGGEVGRVAVTRTGDAEGRGLLSGAPEDETAEEKEARMEHLRRRGRSSKVQGQRKTHRKTTVDKDGDEE